MRRVFTRRVFSSNYYIFFSNPLDIPRGMWYVSFGSYYIFYNSFREVIEMKKSWLDRFAGAVRWYLPRPEADDVLSDYREMLDRDARSEAQLRSDLGKPRQAARMLVQPRPYLVWLGVFAVLALCLAVPGLSPLPGLGGPRFWDTLFGLYNLARLPALLGAVGAMVWFRWKGRKEERLPGAIPIFLAVMLFWCVLVLLFHWVWMHDPEKLANLLGQVPNLIGPPGRMVPLMVVLTGEGLEWIGGFCMVLVGLYALVKARTEDRRWAAVYILAMTAMMVSLTVLALMVSMNINGPDLWFLTFQCCLCYAIVGLVGTGVALC